MRRHLDPKTYDDQNQIIVEKYRAGWRIPVIAGYIGVSTSLICGRLNILERDKGLERRRNSGN
jgi:hypothetical protein